MRLQLDGADEQPSRLWIAWAALAMRAWRERPLWLALVVGLVAIAAAYQTPRPLLLDIGGSLDAPNVIGFYLPEQNADANYRWSTANSSLNFQGIGKPFSPLTVHLQLSGGPKPKQVQVRANGHTLPPLNLTPKSADYALTVDPAWMGPSGDLRLDFTSPTFQQGTDKRLLGFLADLARVDRPSGLILPSLTQLLGLLLCAVLLYLLLRSVWLAQGGAGLLTALFLLGCAAIIGVQRLLLTMFTWQLLIALLITLLVGIVAEVATRWVVQAAGRRGERRVPEYAWTALRGLVMLTAALKVGGLLYPLSFIIDAEFHLKYITYANEVFFHGRSWDQYFGLSSQSLSFAVMPKEEWGAARAFIPYSPFFYIVSVPLAWLPAPISISVPVVSGILEALKVPLVFMLGLATGGLGRQESGKSSVKRAALVAIAAAGIYALIPATFLLQQWGNWPTLLSLWLVTAWAAFTMLFWPRITRPRVWLASTVLLLLAMLSYTVSAAYTGMLVVALVVIGWLFAPAERRKWGALCLSLVAATALSMLLYYGQYVGQVLNNTLPTFENAAQTQGSISTLRSTPWAFLIDTLARPFYSYNLTLAYLIGVLGALWLFVGLPGRPGRATQKQTQRSPQPRHVYALLAQTDGRRGFVFGLSWQRAWIGAWLLVLLPLVLADYYIDQVLKEFWYIMPAVAVTGGVWLTAFVRRGQASRLYTWLVCLLVGALAWQSLSLWVFRLLFHNR